jgi:hypothetical protein
MSVLSIVCETCSRLFGHLIFLGVLLKECEILLEISIYRHCMNHALKIYMCNVHHFY